MKYQSNSSKHLIPIVVGVTGHRDLREEDIPELEKKVEAIFKEIEHKYKDKYQHVPIKILSPMRGRTGCWHGLVFMQVIQT